VLEKLLNWLPLAVYALLAAYLVAWGVLLIACLRRRRFYPILDDDRRTRLFWLVSFAFLNPLMTLAYFVFGQRRQPDARNVRIPAVPVGLMMIVLAVSGFFVNVPGVTHLWMVPIIADRGGEGGGGGEDRSITLGAQAAVIEAKSNTNSSTVSSAVSHARFACRRIDVIVESDHPLIKLVARRVRQRLEEFATVDAVEVFVDGQLPEPGRRRADLFLRLGLPEISEVPVPYSLSLKALIEVNAGTSPWRSTSSYHDGYSPPLLSFGWEASVNHQSKTVGVERVKYTMAADNIAKEIAGQLAKAFDKWIKKHGPVPELPLELYGPYRPAELPAAMEALGCEMLLSHSDLLLHNETFWRFETREDVAELLKSLGKQLAAEGWRRLSLSKTNLRFAKGEKRIHVYRVRRPTKTGWVVVKPNNTPKPPVELCIRYRERFTDARRGEALDRLLSGQTAVGTLLFFSGQYTDGQRRRMYERFENLPRPTLGVLLELMDHYLAAERIDDAGKAIARARALLWIERDAGSQNKRIDKAVKKLAEKLAEEPPKKPPPPTADDFRAVGFLDVDAATTPVELEVGLDEPLAAFYRCGDGEFCVFSLRVAGPDGAKSGRPFSLKHMQARPHMRSWSTGPGNVGPDGLWTGMCFDTVAPSRCLTFRVTQIKGPEARFKVRIEPPDPAATPRTR